MRGRSGVHAAQPAGVGRWWGSGQRAGAAGRDGHGDRGLLNRGDRLIVSANTSQSIQQQYTDDLATGARIYDAVLGYWATHPTWDGWAR